MGKYQFIMDTRGHCFLCFEPVIAIKSAQQEEEEEQSVQKVISFEALCRYLTTNLRKLLGETMPNASGMVTILEQSELKGILCERCAQQYDKFSRYFLELEVIQMKLLSCLQSIHAIIISDNDKGNGESHLEQFRKDMLGQPETLLQYKIVERLRRDIFDQCSKRIGEALPKVALTKMNQVQPEMMEMDEAEERMPKSTWSSLPIITSVQGNCSQPPSSPPPFELNPNMPMLFQCDICHLKVSDLSTHLYTVHFDEAEVEVEMECQVEQVKCENLADKNPLGEEEDEEDDQSPPPIIIGESNGIAAKGCRLRCNFCPQSFGKRISLQNHHKTDHPNLGFECYLCNEHYAKKSILNRHQQIVHFRRSTRCKFCFDWFTNQRCVNIHLKTCLVKNAPPAVVRNGCIETALTSSAVLISALKKLQECDICHKHFLTRQGRSRHRHLEHQGNGFACERCNEMFTDLPAKLSHQNTCQKKIDEEDFS